eukprot:5119702-Amphidinium_carterae.1
MDNLMGNHIAPAWPGGGLAGISANYNPQHIAFPANEHNPIGMYYTANGLSSDVSMQAADGTSQI